MGQFFIGTALALLVVSIAYRTHSLNKSGAIAAVFIGTVIFGLGGWKYGVLLLAFFVSSSALSHSFANFKQGLDEKYSKGNQRDAGQVLGNGSIPALFAAFHLFFPNEGWAWLGFASAVAAVNADTWATELGVLDPNPPRLITNLGRVVEKGTSGGVSVIGTLASLAGAAVIGVLAASLEPTSHFLATLMIVTVSGLAGSLFDSFLGGTVQAMYYCPTDKSETEKHPLHTCGTKTVHIRGWKWLGNDLVNFSCGSFGVLITRLILGNS